MRERVGSVRIDVCEGGGSEQGLRCQVRLPGSGPAGLDVEIFRGYGSTEAVKRSALGTTTFAMADTAAVMIGRDNGLATRQIATILDCSSEAVCFFKSSGIKAPSDRKGRTFGAQAATIASITSFAT